MRCLVCRRSSGVACGALIEADEHRHVPHFEFEEPSPARIRCVSFAPITGASLHRGHRLFRTPP